MLPIRKVVETHSGRKVTVLEYDVDVNVPNKGVKTIPMKLIVGPAQADDLPGVNNGLGMAILKLLDMVEKPQLEELPVEEHREKRRK